MRSYNSGRKDYWVPIEKCDTETAIKKSSAFSSFSSIQSTTFTLTLAWASNVH